MIEAAGHTFIKITISYISIEFWDRLLVNEMDKHPFKVKQLSISG